MPVIIKQPETSEEFERYYDLRWRLLRAPWGEPRGSETDDIEDECFHVIAVENDIVIGVGRLQYNSDSEAQIRYMAVEPSNEGKGIGRQLVAVMEKEAVNTSHQRAVLDAREPAIGFYKKLGYEITGKSYLLFNNIQHYRMGKKL